MSAWLLRALLFVLCSCAVGSSVPPAQVASSRPAGLRDPSLPTSRDDLIRAFLGALVSHDVHALERFADPVATWTRTLECPPVAGLKRQRQRLVKLVADTRNVSSIALVSVRRDTVLLSVPKAYNAYGCVEKMSASYHHIVLQLRITGNDGQVYPGEAEFQGFETEAGWMMALAYPPTLRTDAAAAPAGR